MTGSGMREAHAQESRISAREVQQAFERLNPHFTAIRTTFTQMQEAGITPVQVTYTDTNVRQLLGALVQLNQSLRPHNGGSDVIPITGSSDREKFRSMNTWLGRDPDAALNAAGLRLLEERVQAALGTPSAGASVPPVLAQVTPTPAQPAREERPQPAPVPAPTVRPSPRETVPARTEQPPVAATSASEQHAQLLDNLEVIAGYGRNQATRRSAQQSIDRIRAELDRDGGPRETQLNRLVTAAQRTVERELARSQTRASEARMADVPGIANARAHPLRSQVTSAISDLQAIAADQSLSQERRDLANQLINLENDALLLGIDPATRIVTRINEARDALREGNETIAREKQTAANRISTQEQQLLRQRLELAVPIAQAALTAIDGSHLPTRDEHAANTRADGVRRGTYDHVQPPGSTRRIRTGREDLRSSMEVRLRRAREMLQNAQSGEPLSYHTVTELYQSITLEERTMRSIIDLWEYARGHNIENLPTAQRVGLRRQYSFAVAALLDPDFIPYEQYSAETRRGMARAFLRMRGGRVTDDQVRMAERQLLPALMRSSEFRYEDALNKLYLEVSRLAPQVPAASSEITTMAAMRRLRPFIRTEYLPYVIRMRFQIVSAGDVVQESYQGLLEPELQAQERLTMARGFLDSVISASGLAADDSMRQAATAWLTHSQNVQPADIPAVSDTLYHMALSIAAIREAQLWSSTASLRGNLSASAQQRADALIAQARQTFRRSFSSPQVDPGFHPNLAENLANRAINILSPRGLQATETSATISSNEAYASPASVGVSIADPEHITDQERVQGSQVSEERYLRFLASVRGDASFGVSAYERADASTRRAYALLNPVVGRSPSASSLAGHPILTKTDGRGRTSVTSVDQHVVAYPNTRDAALANNRQEDLSLSQYGQVYQELYRLSVLRGNDATPDLLRGIDPTPLEGRMTTLSRHYATATPAEQVAAGNAILLNILDTRLQELRTRLDGEILLVSGRRFRRRDLARSEDPRAMYAIRAVEIERDLGEVRQQLQSGRGGDLFTGRLDPRLSIAMAELGIASLDDDILRTFTDPRPRGGLDESLNNFVFYVPRTSITPDRYSRGDSRRVRFTAEQVMVRQRDGESMSLADFQRRYRSEHQRTVNLSYYWFVYQNLGRRDEHGPIQYLRNPQYDPSSTIASRRQSHIGQVMNDITLTDGTRIARAVVRVRPSGLPAGQVEWVPILDGRQRVRPSDVLFTIEGNGLDPVRDERFQRNMESVCAPTDHNQYWTYERGESTPVLIVSPRSTTEVAATRRSR